MKTKSARPRHSGKAPRKTGSDVGTSAPALRYIESSALVASLLEGDLHAKSSTQGKGQAVISALTATETMRAIVRAKFAERITAQRYRTVVRNLSRFLKKCFIAEVNEAVLERAGRPFPIEPVRTLDAIHLATLENLAESPAQVIVVTRDHRVRDNAIALGYQVA